MRRYGDPVEVRKGMVSGLEGPEQFLWRGRLWKVRAVLSHWVETGPWWQSGSVRAVLGAESEYVAETGPAAGARGAGLAPVDLTAEREVWRVEAARGHSAAAAYMRASDPSSDPSGGGVFDLVFDWSQGSWELARCLD